MFPSIPKREPPNNLKADYLITDDPNAISNQFNDYFCSFGAKQII